MINGQRENQMSTQSRPSRRAVNHGAVTAVVCVALAAVVAAMASLNVALPDIARSTHASQTQLEWVIDAYSLIFAALLLPAGAFGDRYGRRRALVAGLVIFGSASAAAMTVNSAGALIVLRGVLGLGASLVMPATLSTITSTFPAEQRTRAVSIWAAVAGGSAVLGLLASGALLHVWSWPAVFGLNVVLAGVALIGTLRVVPESADDDAPRLDLVGAVIAAIGLLVMVFSIIEAPDHGWLSTRTLGGIGLAAVVLTTFVIWELRHASPMLDPRVFRHPQLAAGSMSILVQFFAFFGYTFIVLQYLQLVRGDSPIVAAVSVLPMAAVMMPVSRVTPALVARIGTRWVCAGGLGLMAVGFLALAQLNADSAYLLFLAGLLPLGAGMGAAMTPATSAITDALPSSQQGVGSALNDLSRELGGALGIAVLGSVLDATYRSHLQVSHVPAALAGKARDSFAVAAHLGGPVNAHARTAFLTGMHAAFWCAAVAVLLAAVGVLTLLRASATAPQSNVSLLGREQGSDSVEDGVDVVGAVRSKADQQAGQRRGGAIDAMSDVPS
jgi:EmrB/QacA subfamily drug resistance transporter